ncbi:MAG: DUF2695 domain-containing protein [Intrasporangium sp.]|uniref:DUF2695 domain-containing protein n=1 Tax=Intrasporangium sp. TaxID=1925024 RepID=UPI002647305F|nr:DUF2695 domain-containing protein [Intrasporangium sp.]MDN5794584.1 DUF2695 domain-containing protein [Intrasporangium sp.]
MSNVIHLLTRRPIQSPQEVLPRPEECLACFVHRMVGLQGCSDALRWVEQFRVHRARRATALTRRLTAQGARCDCSVTDVVWRVGPELWEWAWDGRLVPPEVVPPCRGVRPNSTQPCRHWVAADELAM